MLVLDAVGRDDPMALRAVTTTVFIYALGLGFVFRVFLQWERQVVFVRVVYEGWGCMRRRRHC